MDQREMVNNDKVSIKTYFLILSIIFTFVNNFKYGGGISSIIIFIIGFGAFAFLSGAKFKLTIIHALFFLFWFFATISTMISPLVNLQQDSISFLIAVAFLVLATSVNYSEREIKLVLSSYICTAFISSINIIYNVIIGHQATWNRYSTSFFGIDKDPNYASAYIVPAVMILLYTIFFKPSKEKKWLYISLLVVTTLGTISTGSRGAFLFLLFCYVYIFLIITFKASKRIRTVLVFGVIGLALLVFWNLAINYFPESMVVRLATVSSYTEDSTRLNIWKEGIKVFFEYPLIGGGLNGGNSYLLSRGYPHSHNVYLDILTNTGLIGSLIFILIIFNILKVKKDDKLFIIGAIVVFLGPLFFINGFNTPSFWIPLIILVILQKNSLRTNKKISDLV